jgi:hypothetical protein
VYQAQFDLLAARKGREFLDEFVHGREGAADDAVAADFTGVGGAMEMAIVGLVRSRSLGLRPATLRILFGASQAPQVFMDVQSDVMHDFVHG